MSLFGSLMGDFDDDIFGNHMNAMNMQMRSMNRLMNTFMPDPFNMLTNFDPGFQQNALMERQNPHPHHQMGLFGFPAMPNMNRLLTTDIGNNGGAAFCSSSVITMSSGPDGRPQIYQATSSTKTGPGGIRETRRTVQDSVNGVKKMAIGHHIGERAHIIEKEQDLRSGQLEEHQEFINLEEDDAEDFDREFTTKAHHGSGGRGGMRAIAAPPQQTLTIEPLDDDDDDDDVIETTGIQQLQQRPTSSSHQRRHMPAMPSPPQPPSTQTHQNSSSNLNTSSSSTTSSATQMSPSSSTTATTNKLNAAANASTSIPRPSNTTNTNNQYNINATPRRSAGAYRSSHHLTGASPRRPLRTPPSSPLATTPTLHSHSTTSTPSVHPHPYNTSAARRAHHHHHNHHHHHHRSKHAKQQQQSSASTNSNNQTVHDAGNTNTSSSQPQELKDTQQNHPQQ